jgi:TetR/AcrR family hemagglutinin/protease transcriptional regulator
VSAPNSIEAVLMAFCDSIDSDPDYVRVWLEWSVSIRAGLWESYLRFYRKALAGIRTILERGVDASSIRADLDLDDAARVIVGLAHMVAQMKFSGASREQVVRTVHSLVQGYLERGK